MGNNSCRNLSPGTIHNGNNKTSIMKIEKNKVVEILYDLVTEGQKVDSATKDNPLDYIHGTNMLLPKFEAEVDGLEEGDTFSFTVSPEEGYGEYDPSKKITLSKNAFKIDGVVREDLLVVGYVIPMLNRDGNVEQGTILEVNEDSVIMDFNHPMAGKTLNFSGKVIEVRDATDRELSEGLHGEYLPPEEGGKRCRRHGGRCHKEEEGGGCCKDEGKEGDGCCRKEGTEGCCKDKE